MDDVTQELHNAQWRKSTLSGGDGSNCVEVAELSGGRRAVRDSKDHGGPALVFTPGDWAAFIGGVKNGEFG